MRQTKTESLIDALESEIKRLDKENKELKERIRLLTINQEKE